VPRKSRYLIGPGEGKGKEEGGVEEQEEKGGDRVEGINGDETKES